MAERAQGRGAVAAVAIAAMALLAAAPGAAAKFSNPCVTPSGDPGAGDCHRPSFSRNNRFVAFDSDADDLVRGDDNGKSDVFVRDLKRRKTELISTDPQGETPKGVSFQADISADGRYVAFVSVAPGVVEGVKGGKRQVYLRDRKSGKTTLVSATSSGKPAAGDSDQPAVDGDGSVVVFRSKAKNLVSGDLNKRADVFAAEIGKNGRTIRANTTSSTATSSGLEDKAGAEEPSVSDDGRFVAFTTGTGTELTAGSKKTEVYVKDLQTRALELISQGPGGVPGDDYDYQAEISGDGRYVVWSSGSSNLGIGPAGGEPYGVDVLVRDRLAQTTVRASVDSGGIATENQEFNPSISDQATKVAWLDADDEDIYVRDMATGVTTKATPDTKDRGDDCGHSLGFICGEVSTPVLSGDGSLLGFEGAATGYVPHDAKYIDVIIRG